MRHELLRIITIFILLVMTQCSTFKFELTSDNEKDSEGCKNCDCCIENQCKSLDNCKNVSTLGLIVMVSIIVFIFIGFIICYFIQKKRDRRYDRSFQRRLQEVTNSTIANHTQVGSGTTNNISYLDDTVNNLLNYLIYSK